MMSFSAGANCFNAPELLAGGMQTVTSCSDLLKTGGYRRLLQYLECLDEAIDNINRWSRYVLARQFSDPSGWELQNMLTVARVVIRAALARAHRRAHSQRQVGGSKCW